MNVLEPVLMENLPSFLTNIVQHTTNKYQVGDKLEVMVIALVKNSPSTLQTAKGPLNNAPCTTLFGIKYLLLSGEYTIAAEPLNKIF